MKSRAATRTLALAMLVGLGAGCDREAGDAVADVDTVPEAPAAAPATNDMTAGADGVANADMVAGTTDFVGWDSSRDGMIDSTEFNTGFNQRFRDWDSDNDGKLNEAEFKTVSSGWRDAPGGVDTNGLFDVWDADEDGLIDNNEFGTGAYSTWDRDRNNLIDTTEYNDGVNWFGWG